MATSTLQIPATLGPTLGPLAGLITRGSPGLQSSWSNPVAGLDFESLQHVSVGGYRISALAPTTNSQSQVFQHNQDAPAWAGGQTYWVGCIVTYNGQAYRFLPVGPAVAPATTPDVTPGTWALMNAANSPAGTKLRGNSRITILSHSISGTAPATLQLNVQESTPPGNPDPSLTLIGTSLDGVTSKDHVCRSNGYFDCEGLRITNSKYVADPSIGTATLGDGGDPAGTRIITTAASDASSRIFVQHTAKNASTAIGTLQVINKLANSFEVVSLDSTGAIETNDASSFDWWVVNPVW